MVDQHVLGLVDVLGRVGRLLAGDTLAPPLALIGGSGQEQDVTLGLDAERRLERSHEGHPDAAQLDGLELHALKLSSCALSSSPSVRSAAAAFSSSWRTLEAPGIATTFGMRISQASATCDGVAPWRPAISFSAATRGAQRARPSGLKSALIRRKFDGAACWYLPESRP